MTSIDYDAGKAFIESMMIDRCVVTRDKERVFDAVLDQETGILIEPNPDAVRVYSGCCLAKRPSRSRQTGAIEGGSEQTRADYELLVPFRVIDIRYEDRVVVTSTRDRLLDNKRFRVLNVNAGTHATYRRVDLAEVGLAG